jgi:hypothetical protein
MSTEISNDVNARLSRIEETLGAIAAELTVARRQREELEELKEDLLAISKDIFQATVVELEEVAPFVKTGTFKELGKRALRNAENISRLMDLLESMAGLMEDGQPISKELFNDALEQFERLEQRGHFELMRHGMNVLDRVAMTHKELKPDEVEPMSTLQLLKEMRSPEVRKAMTCALAYLKGACGTNQVKQ